MHIPLAVLHVQRVEIFLALPQAIQHLAANHIADHGKKKRSTCRYKEWLRARKRKESGGSWHSRVVVFLVDHVDLWPRREVHIVVRALQPYSPAMLSMQDPISGVCLLAVKTRRGGGSETCRTFFAQQRAP